MNKTGHTVLHSSFPDLRNTPGVTVTTTSQTMCEDGNPVYLSMNKNNRVPMNNQILDFGDSVMEEHFKPHSKSLGETCGGRWKRTVTGTTKATVNNNKKAKIVARELSSLECSFR